MASFLQAELPSDDEADEDFNPTLPKEDTDSTEKKNTEKQLPKGESSHTKAARKARVDALWEQLSARCAPPKRAKGGGVPREKASTPEATNTNEVRMVLPSTRRAVLFVVWKSATTTSYS